MIPNQFEKQGFDFDDLTQPQATVMMHRSSDEDDNAPPFAAGNKRCVDCGSPIPDGSKYCPSCGREQ